MVEYTLPYEQVVVVSIDKVLYVVENENKFNVRHELSSSIPPSNIMTTHYVVRI